MSFNAPMDQLVSMTTGGVTTMSTVEIGRTRRVAVSLLYTLTSFLILGSYDKLFGSVIDLYCTDKVRPYFPQSQCLKVF